MTDSAGLPYAAAQRSIGIIVTQPQLVQVSDPTTTPRGKAAGKNVDFNIPSAVKRAIETLRVTQFPSGCIDLLEKIRDAHG